MCLVYTLTNQPVKFSTPNKRVFVRNTHIWLTHRIVKNFNNIGLYFKIIICCFVLFKYSYAYWIACLAALISVKHTPLIMILWITLEVQLTYILILIASTIQNTYRSIIVLYILTSIFFFFSTKKFTIEHHTRNSYSVL